MYTNGTAPLSNNSGLEPDSYMPLAWSREIL